VLDHEHDVAERGDVGTAGRRGPEQAADLRDVSGRLNLVVEDLSGPSPAREEVHLVGNAGTGGVDEIEDGVGVLAGELDDADDLLDRSSAPRTCLDRRVVGHDRDRATVDAAHPGDDSVGREITAQGIDQEPVLGEAVHRVEQQREPLAHEQLVLLRQPRMVLLGPPLLGARGELGEVREPGAGIGHRGGDPKGAGPGSQ